MHVGSRALLLALPLLALAVLRLAPPMPLAATSLSAWLAPAAGAVVALGAGACMLVALIEGLRSGSAASLLNAAGEGSLAVTYALEALSGPASSAFLPSAASAVGGVLAASLLLAAATLGFLRVQVGGPRGRVLSLLAVFALVELAVVAVVVTSSAGFRQPTEMALRLLGVGLLTLTAVVVATHARHLLARAFLAPAFLAPAFLAPAFLAVGTLCLAAARTGSADVLIALAALATGMAVFFVMHVGMLHLGEPTTEERARDAIAPLPDMPPHEAELGDGARLTRELHGTIDELLRARRTIELQRGELERAATVDPLTGVASRRAILERLRLESAEARRYQHPFAALLLDVDRLATVNREHGLDIGDAVLREVALRMRLRIREADGLGRSGSAGFLAILPHTDERGAALFADTLRRRIGGREVLTDAGELNVTVSIGVAIMRPEMDLSDEDVLANAHEALSSARAAGGDRIAFDRAHGLARLEERRQAPSVKDDSAQDSGA